MSQLRVTLERRALGVLLILAGVSALLGGALLAMEALDPMDSPLLPNLLYALSGVAGVAVLAATASYVATSPQRTLARVGLGFLLGVVALRHVFPLLTEALSAEARADLFDVLPTVFSVLGAIATACVLSAIALSSRGGARAMGLALAALAIGIRLAVILLRGEKLGAAWDIVLEVLSDLTPIAAYFVRWYTLGAATTDERASGVPLAGREDWQVAASGAGTLRVAVVLQIVVVSGVFVLGLVSALGRGGAGGLGLIVVILGLLGAVAVVALYVVGLGRLGRIPWVSEARAPISAAFQMTLLSCLVGLLLLSTTVILVARPSLLEDSLWLLGEYKEAMARLGLVASVALLFALRRVAIQLGAPRLRTMAVTTLWLQLAGYVPTAALQLMHDRLIDAEPSAGVLIALGFLGVGLGIAGWACLLVALRELVTALSGSTLADAFRSTPPEEETP